MRGRCAVPRTLFQCVCTQHRNRIGRLSPFSKYAPSASRFKPDCSPQSKVTYSQTGALNMARTANRWLPVGCILAPDSLCGGQRRGCEPVQKSSARPGDVCLLEQSRPQVETRTFPCLTRPGRRLVLNIHSSHTGRQRVALRGVVPPLTMPKLLAASARRLMRI